MRKLFAMLGLVAMMVMLVAPAASAHDHRMCVPGQGDPVIGAEPFHSGPGTVPGNAQADFTSNPNWTGAWGFHPIHSSLHQGNNPHFFITGSPPGPCP